MKKGLLIFGILCFFSTLGWSQFSKKYCTGDENAVLTFTEEAEDHIYIWMVDGKEVQRGKEQTFTVTKEHMDKAICVQWQCPCGSLKENCTSIDTDESSDYQIAAMPSPITCNGLNDGQIMINTPDEGEFTYKWKDGNTSKNRYNLKAGEYQVTVTNENGCTQTASVMITEPKPLKVGNIEIKHPTCGKTATGFAEVMTNKNYDYLWNTGEQTRRIENLSEGTYSVQIRKGKKCSVKSIELQDPEPPTVIPTVISDYNGYSVSCVGRKDGEVQLAFTGGTPPYQVKWHKNDRFTWSEGDTLPIKSSLSAMAYPVSIIDQKGCTNQKDVILNAPEPLAVQTISDNFGDKQIKCSGDDSGIIQTELSGGVGPYQFQWTHRDSVISTRQNLSNLSKGLYRLQVADANGCMAKSKIRLRQPRKIVAPIKRKKNRRVIQPIGGEGKYTIDIYAKSASKKAAETDYRAVLTANTSKPLSFKTQPKMNYEVHITDENGCSITRTFYVPPKRKPKKIRRKSKKKGSLAIPKGNKFVKKGRMKCYVFN